MTPWHFHEQFKTPTKQQTNLDVTLHVSQNLCAANYDLPWKQTREIGKVRRVVKMTGEFSCLTWRKHNQDFFAFLGTSVVSLVIGKIPESIALVFFALRAMVSLPCLTQVMEGLCGWSVDPMHFWYGEELSLSVTAFDYGPIESHCDFQNNAKL